MTMSGLERADLVKIKSDVHHIDWRQSILNQLQLRRCIEQNPFEDLCSLASNMCDRIDVCTRENIRLNLRTEQLRQQLLEIQQTLLAGGTPAAKTILSKISSAGINDEVGDLSLGSSSANKNLSEQYTALLEEKCLLDKKILELQEKLADALKSKSDAVQRIVDLKTEIEEKDKLNRQLNISLDDKDICIQDLRAQLERSAADWRELDSKHRTLTDEHLVLSLTYKKLEKKHHALQIECDTLSSQILVVKREDAERLNAENDRILKMQQEKRRKELEANVAEINKIQIAKQSAGDTSALTLASMAAENFEAFEDYPPEIMGVSRIPKEIQFTFEAHEGEFCAFIWYCRGGPRDHFLATGGTDRKVKLWKVDVDSASVVTTLQGSNKSITSLDIESDLILASSNDYATRVWNTSDYRAKITLTGHSCPVSSAKFLGNPHKIASGSQDRTIKIWDIVSGSCIKTWFAGSTCRDVSYYNSQVISGHVDSKVRCWDLRRPNDNECSGQIALQDKVTSLDVSKDGMRVICSLRDNTIKLVDLRKMEVLQTYSDERFKIGSDHCRAKFSIDSQYIACGSQDGSLHIWDTNTAKVEKILTGPTNTMLAACWSPDGKRVASIERGGKYSKVSIWH